MGSEGALPERVSENVKRDANGNEVGYARYYVYPDSKQKLYDWIEDAYAARTTRSNLIKNPNEMILKNGKYGSAFYSDQHRNGFLQRITGSLNQYFEQEFYCTLRLEWVIWILSL